MFLGRLHTHDRFGWRDVLLALALFAAVIRALIPQGFMLSTEDGAPKVVICTASDARSPDTHDTADKADALAGMHAPCAFAGLSAMALAPDLPILSMAQAIVLKQVALDERASAPAERAFRPQAQRAPPTLHA